MKEKVSFLCHLLTSLASVVCAVLCFVEASVITSKEYEGWDGLGAGIGAAVLIIIGFILIFYFLLSLIPTFVGLRGIRLPRKRYFITNAVFEILFLIAYIAIAIAANSTPTFLIFGCAALPLIIALICNVLIAREL